MKGFTFLLLLTVSISFQSFSQWQVVGEAGISEGYAWDISIETDNDGIPLVCYNDAVNGSRPTVQKFNGTDWETVGIKGFTPGSVFTPVMKLDNNGTPHVAFADGTNGQRLSVMKFDGSNWIYVGNAGFTNDIASGDLSFAPDGTPYVAIVDYSKQNKITVMKFNGSDWVNVGPAGFSQYGINYPDIEITSDGTPIVCYLETPTSFLSAKKFNGSSWEFLGQQGFSQYGGVPRLKLNQSDSVFVLHPSLSGIKVSKFTGIGSTGWEQVGSEVFSNATGIYNLTINEQSIPFVAYTEYWNKWKSVVKKFENNVWEIVGGTYAHEDSAEWINIINDKFGNLYIAFKEVELDKKVTVKKFGNFNSIQFMNSSKTFFNVFPNPSNDFITIKDSMNDYGDGLLTVFSMEGKKMLQQLYPLKSPVDVRNLPPGIYMVSVTCLNQNRIYHSRFVKE